ncbi:PREDICTED: uncharacterized protein LOC106741612 [Dinoponera quadriceps]|uniref:Uncharacterized protein LOC106741612 n=1 Tax=Dinoponera quadriceps TaxID=609295 RepID=A0A6P3WT90_DINQU|nr:PREDICTED: uncharacterized protein LOC106741612 [Dinoponera quadriceps]
MRMPEIMAETFVRGLVDKIMVEVLNVIVTMQNGKPWEQRVDEETGDGQSELVHGRSQAHVQVNYSKADEMELIAKIVRDLRDVQIGDSCYVLPPPLLALEKQVKNTAGNIEDAPGATDAIETRTTQGQGDTHTSEQTETVRKEKEEGEAANVSIGLLHQLIEELQNKQISATSSKNVASLTTSTSSGEEHISIWEEEEEQFIRTIEHPGNPTFRASESAACFRDVELQSREEPTAELRSRSSQHAASTSRETCLEEVPIVKYESSPLSKSRRENAAMMEEILIVDDIETQKEGEATMATNKKKKKKGLGGRLRRFFRAVFGRKN